MKHEAFAYKWTHEKTGMCYVGYHIGSQSDGYISSSDEFNRVHADGGYSREILAVGTAAEMKAFETGWLRGVNARQSILYINKWNNDTDYVESLKAEKHGRALLQGMLMKAGEQPGAGRKSKESFYVIYIGETMVSCNPEWVSKSDDKRLQSMVGKPVNATVTWQGGFAYFTPNNVNLLEEVE